jgi:tRNA-modifying protein YgfZ
VVSGTGRPTALESITGGLTGPGSGTELLCQNGALISRLGRPPTAHNPRLSVFRSVLLDDLRALAVSGPDRLSFLQGQLTQDVTTARTASTVLAGWADAKGRLLFAGHLFSTPVGSDDALALLVPAELADALLKRLRMYVLRAKAQITLLDQPIVGLLGTAGPTGDGQAVRILGEDRRHILLGPAPGTAECPRSEWQLADIRAGIPTIVAATSGEFVPQMVNLDLLSGISFTKGCYTGQEIVARMKYLGRVKRRMLRFSAGGIPPVAGAALYAERGAVAQVVRSAPTETGCEFLAVAVLDDLPGPFFLDEARTRPVRRLELPYDVPA